MKNLNTFSATTILFLTIILSAFIVSCSENNNEKTLNNEDLFETDKEALLFMLEEEKLARDTYDFLDNQWGINQFANIKKSEQTHMNAVANLLNQYNISYTILPYGEFYNETLQNFYDQFVESGQLSQANALQIGATIEDLDIVDLQDYIDGTANVSMIAVFEGLQCGSKNHLRAFTTAIETSGDVYSPQFLTEEDYNSILSGTNEKCSF